VVLYTWLDCLDGKQARRTGTSSPLGQLFDHGCDALSVNLLLGNIACSLSIGCGWAHALGELGVRACVRVRVCVRVWCAG
jgi:ethanolaminephosphotransferase